MKTMQSYRKVCLNQQTELRRKLKGSGPPEEAIRLFFQQHAMLHSAEVSQAETWSYEDAILGDMSEAQVRRIPQNCEHSVAWLIWHIARCEDITMNLLVAGSPQVLNQDAWLAKVRAPICHTGNLMSLAEITDFSSQVDIPALRAYRQAVGRRTREIVAQIQPEQLQHKVDPLRLQTVLDEGAVVEAAMEIVEYWGTRDFAGLLLMPATRHNLTHLNEALQIKRKR